jgi:hypothetical protein
LQCNLSCLFPEGRVSAVSCGTYAVLSATSDEADVRCVYGADGALISASYCDSGGCLGGSFDVDAGASCVDGGTPVTSCQIVTPGVGGASGASGAGGGAGLEDASADGDGG